MWNSGEIQSKGDNGKSMHVDGYSGHCTILGLCEWCPPSHLQNCAVPNLHSHIQWPWEGVAEEDF